MGIASKIGKFFAVLIGLFVLIGVIGFIMYSDFGDSCPSGTYQVDSSHCCPYGQVSDGRGYCVDEYVPARVVTTPSYTQPGGSGGGSGSNCGGYGTLYVTKPISILSAGVVEVDGYTVGATNMPITVSTGSHYVEAWGITGSGYEQRQGWNTYVSECKQSLIKWN
ncbi:MAG: hypothetical protein HQ505_01940 [Nitrosopumilus sp.]|nr:hypothetical protein [Nitrosopumilus sp.]